MRDDSAMPSSFFQQGDPVWVEQPDGSLRPGVYVGEADQATWFGGLPRVYVVHPESEEGEEVQLVHVTHRNEDESAG